MLDSLIGELSEKIHVVAVILAIATAFTTDAYFFKTIKSGIFSARAVLVLSRLSKVVWASTIVIILSGLMLFLQLPALYLNNSQFWAKMTIVVIILVNGSVFHFYHLPLLKKLKDQPISKLAIYPRRRELLLISGAFSSISWIAAFLLGKTMSDSASYGFLMMVYGVVIVLACATALGLKNLLIPVKKKN